MKKLNLLFIAFVFLVGYTNAQWTQVSGLNGGDFRCLAKVGTDLYAGSVLGGVFHSSNNGDTWTPKLNGLPTSIAVSAILERDTKLFAGTSFGSVQGVGVYRSDDGGDTWVEKNNGIIFPEYSIDAALANTTNYIFCATNNSGIYRSNDYGDNWVKVFDQYAPDSNFRAFNATCGNGNIIMAGGVGVVSGIYRSLDEGVHWEFRSQGFPSGCIIFKLISSGVDFYAMTSHGFYWSPSNGQYWIGINSGITYPNNATALCADGSTLYASTFNGNEGPRTYKSVNGGNSWTVLPSMNSYFVKALLASGNNVFAGYIGNYSFAGNGGGVVRSFDGGANWYQASVGLAGISCNAITSNGTHIFAGTAFYSGIYNSSDNGVSWSKSYVPGTIANYNFLSLLSSGSAVYAGTNESSSAGTSGGVYKSIDNGLTWTATADIQVPVYALGANATYIFAGTSNSGMRRSSNSGTTWEIINNGLPSVGEQSIRAMSVNGSKIHIGTARGVFISTNDGTKWVAANGGGEGTPGFTNIYALAVKGDTIFAGGATGILRSFDNGANWTNTYPDHLLGDLVIDGQNVYAGINLMVGDAAGVFVSSDWGATWASMNSTFPYTPEVTSLHKVGTKLFAGTSGSTVWSYDLAASKSLNLASLFIEGLYAGAATMNPAFDENGVHWPTGVADHVKVEFHNATTYSTIEYSAPDVALSTCGVATIQVPASKSGTYYLTIKHRNGIETTSAQPISFAGSTINYSFDIQPKAYGSNMGLSYDGPALIYTGDVNQDGIVDGGDLSNIDNLSAVAASGYLPEDINGDGLIDGSDLSLAGNNAAFAIGVMLP